MTQSVCTPERVFFGDLRQAIERVTRELDANTSVKPALFDMVKDAEEEVKRQLNITRVPEGFMLVQAGTAQEMRDRESEAEEARLLLHSREEEIRRANDARMKAESELTALRGTVHRQMLEIIASQREVFALRNQQEEDPPMVLAHARKDIERLEEECRQLKDAAAMYATQAQHERDASTYLRMQNGQFRSAARTLTEKLADAWWLSASSAYDRLVVLVHDEPEPPDDAKTPF